MRFEASFVGKGQPLVGYTCRVAYTQDAYAAVGEFFAYPVDCHIALCAYQHLALAAQNFVYGFYHGGSLSGSGWAVYYHHIFCPKHLVNGVLLAGVEPWQRDIVEVEASRRGMAVEQVAQIGQAVATGVDYPV